ncbi:hypothetical protein V6N13_108015 [Hibiscus sabdariffa]
MSRITGGIGMHLERHDHCSMLGLYPDAQLFHVCVSASFSTTCATLCTISPTVHRVVARRDTLRTMLYGSQHRSRTKILLKQYMTELKYVDLPSLGE